MSSPDTTSTSVYPVEAYVNAGRRHLVDKDKYQSLCQQSVDDNEAFWAEQAATLDWHTPFTVVKDISFAKDDLQIRGFEDGQLNVCVNGVGRHLPDRSERTPVRLLLSDSATALAGSRRSSFRILGTVGEPINPEVWRWYHGRAGRGRRIGRGSIEPLVRQTADMESSIVSFY